MQFTIATNTLQKQLQALNGAVGAGAVMPILSDFLFELEGNELSISASDMEITMKTKIEVLSSSSGTVAIPAKTLTDIVKTLPDQPITFTIDPDTYMVQIRTQNGEYKIPGESGAEFPEISTLTGTQTVTLHSAVLAHAANKTMFAAGSDQLRPVMTGIFCKLDNNGATFVATDAHKLVKCEHTAQQYENTVSFILPKKALTLLKNTLPADTIVHLTYNQTNALFTFDDVQLKCLLVEGRYPDYSVVIPVDNPNVMAINRTELLNGIKRAAIFSNKSTFEVAFNIADNQLKIHTQDLDFSTEARETFECEYQGEPIEIAFNARFLIEMLASLDTEEVRIEMSAPFRAAIVLPAMQEENEHLLMLIMPIMRHR